MRVVLVSGGSKGLGQHIVQRFLGAGDSVATFSRSATSATKEWQERFADRFHFEELGLSDRDACRRFVGNVQERFGDIEVLVNNAGVTQTSLLALSDVDEADHVIDVNLKGTIHLTRLVSRPMLALGRGRIINISSIVGLSGYRGLSVYSATKAGLDGFTRSLARELGRRNITVNSVAPGYLATEMTETLDEEQARQIIGRTPLGRLGNPAEIAELVHFLASEQASFITGQVMVADGGITC